MKHQVYLPDVVFAEERYGKTLGWCPGVRSEDGHINPHLTQLIDEQGRFISVFHVKPVYYETIYETWRPMDEVALHYGNKHIVLDYKKLDLIHPRYLQWLIRRQELFVDGRLSISSPYADDIIQVTDRLDLPQAAVVSFTTSTLYPDPSPETTTCDGAVAIDNSTSWSAAQTATTGTGAQDSLTFLAFYGLGVRHVSATRYRIDRGHTGFDTSVIGSDTIDSAVCSLFPQSAGEIVNTGGGSDDQFFVTPSSPASNTAITTADFDAIGDSVGSPTEWSSAIDVSALSGTTYNDFTFNATGEAGINKSGVTNLGHRIREDKTAAPSYGTDLRNTWVPESAEDTSGTKDPKFVVVHTAGGGGGVVQKRRRFRLWW